MMKRVAAFLFLFALHARANGQSWEEMNDKFIDSFQARNFKAAATLGEQALQKAKKEFGTGHENYATSLYHLARAYRELGRYSEAAPLLEEAVVIRARFGNEDAEYISMLNSLGLIYKSQGKFYEAEPILIKVLRLNKKIYGENHSHTATSMDNLAGLLLAMGDYEKAGELFQAALKIKRQLVGDQHPAFATSLNNLGMLYLEQGQYGPAEPLFRQALAIYDKEYGKNNALSATTINNLGLLYTNIGDLNRAGSSFIEALKIKKHLFSSEHPSFGTTLNNLALVFQHKGLEKAADSLYKEAVAIKLAALGDQHPDYATSLDNLASFYLASGNYEEAGPLCEKALKIRKASLGTMHPDYATSLNHMAMFHHKSGNFLNAKDLYLQALDLREKTLGDKHPSYTALLSNIAAVYLSLKEYDKAEEVFLAANRKILEQINAYFPALSEKEKDLFLSTIDFHFEVFNSFAADRASLKPAILGQMFDFQLLTKSLILNSLTKVRHAVLNSGNDTLISTFRKWVSLKERIAKAYIMGRESIIFQDIDLNKMESEANALEKLLSLQSKAFASNNDSTFHSWKHIQKKLGPKEAAVEVIRFRRYQQEWTDSVHYAILVVTPRTTNNPALMLLKNGNELDDRLLVVYKKAIAQRLLSRNFGPGTGDSATREELHALYVNYWRKIKSVLDGQKTIYFSPDGVYHLVNLSTLRDPLDSSFVFDEVEIQTVISTRDILRFPAPFNEKAGADAVLIGSPDFRVAASERLEEVKKIEELKRVRTQKEPVAFSVLGSHWPELMIPPLPGTRREVTELQRLLSGRKWNARSYVDKQALEEIVKAARSPQILHIATHGFFLEDTVQQPENNTSPESMRMAENPLLYTGLLLAGSEATLNWKKTDSFVNDSFINVEDGILTALEAENLNLAGTELVVLSACETGLGDLLRNGEGTYSLQRAFKTAGAKSILFTMWKVSDEATQKLMAMFYSNWLQTGDKRSALRKAQATLRKSYPDPYYWGAFILIGD